MLRSASAFNMYLLIAELPGSRENLGRPARGCVFTSLFPFSGYNERQVAPRRSGAPSATQCLGCTQHWAGCLSVYDCFTVGRMALPLSEIVCMNPIGGTHCPCRTQAFDFFLSLLFSFLFIFLFVLINTEPKTKYNVYNSRRVGNPTRPIKNIGSERSCTFPLQ